MTRNFSSNLQSWTAQIKLSTGQLLVLKIQPSTVNFNFQLSYTREVTRQKKKKKKLEK